MKLKLCILPLVGLVAGSLAVLAQDNPPPASPPPAAGATVENKDTAQAAPASAETPAASATVAATDTVAQAATDPAATAAAGDKAASTESNTPVQPGAIIPLIVMDDVPLTDAIKNLARQAGLNYILDPKVAFGQPGPDGRPIPQPSVSIRWENVTAAQALAALLGTYNLQLVEDPKSKIARVTVKDPAAPDPLITRVIQLKYASPTNIVIAIQSALTDKRSKVVPDVRTSQLVVLATEKELSDLEPMVASLDTPTKQVLIEAKLLETSISPSTKKGMDWTGTLQGQHLAFGNNLQTPGVAASQNPVLATDWPKMLFDTSSGFNPGTAFLDADGVNAVFSFLNTYAEAKVISSPRTVTLDNEPARIEVVRASPIIQITPGSVQTAGGSSITYTNLGVILHVTPRVSANNLINLKVIPEVSRIFDTVTKLVSVGSGPGGQYQADEYDIRKIETTVLIPSGNTLVLGGLVQDDIRSGNTKVPILGDIPVVGYLFRSDTKSRQKSNLLVFLTPTIVEDTDFHPTKSKFLHTPVPQSDTLEGDWSSWDSGKPRDWSQPDPPVDTSVDSPQFSKVPDSGN